MGPFSVARAAAADPSALVTPTSPPPAPPVPALPSPPTEPLDVEACVRIALKASGLVAKAHAKVDQFKARLSQVEAVYYPKITATGFIAPMFAVEGDATAVQRRWKSIRDWGPYTRLEAFLAQPLYTFGRAEAGRDAARHRLEVERARLRETQNMVALEVRRFYYTRLFALSMLPSLRNAADIINTALEQGRELYAQASGKVTQADLMRLEFGANEIERFRLMATNGADLATAALKHTMGLPESYPVTFADSRLPRLTDADLQHEALPELAAVLHEAAQRRPEWMQIHEGKQAALAWEQAERLANWPVIALAGIFQGAWAPTRTDVTNPYLWDPYNEVFGGVALGLQWDFDPAKASSKAQEAHATYEQVEALARFAATGIPLQVRKAHQELQQAQKVVALAGDSVKSTRKWMAFAAAAYGTGAGEARDVLEGLVAYLQSKRTYYESVQAYYIAQAELDFAVGVGDKHDTNQP